MIFIAAVILQPITLKTLLTIPIRNVLRVYAREKVRLRRKGTPIKDLDLLIGSTAKATNLILVTENIRHLNRVDGIEIENWIER